MTPGDNAAEKPDALHGRSGVSPLLLKAADLLRLMPMVRGKHRLVHLLAPRLPEPAGDTRLCNGARMAIFEGPGWGRDFWYIHVHEPDVTRVFMRALDKMEVGRSVVDLGANIGYFTLLAAASIGGADKQSVEGTNNGAARDGTSGRARVFAFEPHPGALSELRHNIELNGFDNVVIEAAAVSDTEGEVELHATDIDLGWTSIIKVQEELEPVASVPTLRLDDYFSERSERIGLIKADIQGAEPLAVAGAAKIIERDRPTLILEEWPHGLEQFGSSVTALKELIAGFGYRIFKIEQGRLKWSKVTPVPEKGRDCGYEMGSYTNILCLPDQRSAK